jgi:hypothetical protein
MNSGIWLLNEASRHAFGIDRRVQAQRANDHAEIKRRHTVSDFGG